MKTHIIAQGSIAKSQNGKGKTTLIDLTSSNARIENILQLLVKEDRAPMSGSVTLRAKAEIPPGHRRFLEKVKLRGSFGIGAGIFSKPSTQEGVNKKISNTTSGVKALLLKVMEPFFKKRHKGEVVPVRISGTYEHPAFGLDLERQDRTEGPTALAYVL